MKCAICKKKIDETFLNKIVGTIIKDDKGKRHAICSSCQNKFNNDRSKLLENV